MPSPSFLDSSIVRQIRRRTGDLLPRSILLRRVATNLPVVSLTFDDGPDDDTYALLDLLDRLEILGTFFVLGKQAAVRRDLIEQILARGHDVASHGWAHRRIVSMSPSELASDLERTQSVLPPAPGRRIFRPPFGDISATSLGLTAALGYTTALWSLDSLDSRPISAKAIVERLQRMPICPGDVLLLHEGERRTRKALPEIASILRRKGLHSLPLSRLLQARSGLE